MSTLARILKPELADYGKKLLAAGFRVYVFTSDIERVAKGGLESRASSICFSREVDGKECFASVDYALAGYKFHMPIKPSREHGSGMFIGGLDIEFEDLTVTNAETYASPMGHNPLVGWHENNNERFRHLYTELTE